MKIPMFKHEPVKNVFDLKGTWNQTKKTKRMLPKTNISPNHHLANISPKNDGFQKESPLQGVYLQGQTRC